jgi:hypothetical protein
MTLFAGEVIRWRESQRSIKKLRVSKMIHGLVASKFFKHVQVTEILGV